jgi:hypothetical protein
MDLVGSIVCLIYFPRRERDSVTFRGKGLSNVVADIGPCAKNEDDWRCGRNGCNAEDVRVGLRAGDRVSSYIYRLYFDLTACVIVT